MKQIILITDGCSNVGVSPVVAAARAKAEGIIVNVVGVVDSGEIGMLGSEEIRETAEAGGGMSRIVQSAQLAQTVQMMTRRSVVSTIQQVVGQELRGILGHSQLDRLPPQQRSEVVRVIDDLTETARLQIALLIDASSSMKPKLQAVKDAIQDLQLSLQSRQGTSLLSVFHFPCGLAAEEQAAHCDIEWTTDLANLRGLFYKLTMRGTTPTGPALLQVIEHMIESGGEASAAPGSRITEGTRLPDRLGAARKEGIWSDYVV
ncbi:MULTISPECIES: vWA domain-containing protein [Paenibacillus]|uniref:vWA domain-containing protein n=1 Tax=Paenibacillus TaxID=44249 RepID=UPI0022B89833|nr:vWA domain-containing protein [Paenibacillus caseinilyticus]MCZ8523690.1 VWA domain-containing protein [Paenibacillus caseinilyticus]